VGRPWKRSGARVSKEGFGLVGVAGDQVRRARGEFVGAAGGRERPPRPGRTGPSTAGAPGHEREDDAPQQPNGVERE